MLSVRNCWHIFIVGITIYLSNKRVHAKIALPRNNFSHSLEVLAVESRPKKWAVACRQHFTHVPWFRIREQYLYINLQPTEENSVRFLFFQSLPKAHDQRLGMDRRSTDASKGFAFPCITADIAPIRLSISLCFVLPHGQTQRYLDSFN